MLEAIIRFSIKQKLIIALMVVALIAAGLYSLSQLPIDAVPDITNNQVQVISQAPNLGTEDIEQFITYPVELATSNLPGVVEIRSISRFGLSLVTIVFEDDFSIYLARQLVNEKLMEIRDDIPAGFGKPELGPISTGLGEIYQYTLEVDDAHQGQYSLEDLRSMQDWIVRRQMTMVPGLIEVNAQGGKVKQYEVVVKPDALKAIGLTIDDIFRALEANNQNTGGAYIEKNHLANFIRGEGLARSLDDLREIVVKTEGNVPILIKDVAEVRFGHAVRYGAFTKDGKGEAVGGMMLMLKGANSNDVIKAVKARVALIQQSLPEGVRIVPFLDRSQLISRTTKTVTTNLVIGGLIVIFVLVLLLGNWRGGLIVASTIPLSLLFAFIMMNAFGVWANLMSLGAIDFGIIVDGAVIIVESSVFYLHRRLLSGKNINNAIRDEVAEQASSKMMNSAFFGQLIILIVFLPILALQGVEEKMFRPMALTFSFAMVGVMILCLTYVPMMSAWFIRIKKQEKPSWGDRIVRGLENVYQPVLRRALKAGGWIITVALILLGLAAFTFSRMGGEFIPQLDEGDIAFHALLKPGSALSETIETTTRIEGMVKANFPEVEQIMSRIGVAEVPTDPMPMDIADIFAILKPESEWESGRTKSELIADMKAMVSQLPGVNYEFTQPIEMRFNELITGVREDLAIKLFGEDMDILATKATEIDRLITGIRGVGDKRVEATSGMPQITVRYKRHKLAQYGMQIASLNHMIQAAFAGGKAGVIFEGERRFDLVVRLSPDQRKGIKNLEMLYVNLPNGTQIPLRELAEISYQSGPMQVSRDNTNRRVYVGINVRGRDVESLVEEIQQKLNAELKLPPGYYIRYGGAFENLQRAKKRLQILLPIALGMIFLLIYLALRSMKQSLMIYMAIPLAAIGGVFSLWIRGMPFSISAGVGFIVLFGVAVLNGLVLISGYNELKEEGEENLTDRILRGTRRRIRPILLTALTDILGFLPMAISTSSGAEVQRPLATVVIGGLITSTLLTLLILPILYQWVERRGTQLAPSRTTALVLLLAAACFFPGSAQAQNSPDDFPGISLDAARVRARTQYPALKAQALKIAQAQALTGTASNIGNTQFYTAGEEIGEGGGVYTLIGIQQQLNVFGIKPRKALLAEQVALSQSVSRLSERQLDTEVGLAWAKTLVFRRQYMLQQRLDSLYRAIERAAIIRYESEAISRLELLASTNQARQAENQKQQAWYDYLIVLQKLNLWLNSDSIFAADPGGWEMLVNTDTTGVEPADHPVLSQSRQQLKVADARIQAARSSLLPQLNLQAGLQRIGASNNFFTYQLGLGLPLFAKSQKANIEAVKIGREIAGQNLMQEQLQLNTAYRMAIREYQKWAASWRFFQNERLPLAREQRQAALLAFREGEIDNIRFIQLLRDALQAEKEANEILEKLLESRFRLAYFTADF